jgi:hypothetical protein
VVVAGRIARPGHNLKLVRGKYGRAGETNWLWIVYICGLDMVGRTPTYSTTFGNRDNE